MKTMKARSFYRTYVKNNLFTKLLATLSAISVLTIVTLAYLLYAFIADSARSDILANQRRAMEAVSARLQASSDSVQRIVADLYQDQALSQNVTYLLSHPFADYFRYRIDRYTDEPRAGYGNAITYFERQLAADSSIRQMMLYSSVQQYLYAWKAGGSPQLLELNSALSYIPDAMALELPSISAPNPWVARGLGLDADRVYAVRAAVNNPGTLQKTGQLLVHFSSDSLLSALRPYLDELKGYVLVLTPQGQVLFDSSGRYYGSIYPYASRISSLDAAATLDRPSRVAVLSDSLAGYSVVGVVPDEQLDAATAGLRRTVLLLSGLGILLAVLLPGFAVASVARRTGSLVRLMRRVETGDFAGRIQDERGDELGQIGQGFNRMLDRLNRQIEQEYKAELRQRSTELSAIQARINPHFLSNTLEVIRMRAVSRGADDVAEMIYSLSVLFRSMVGSRSLVPLREELELGRRYLELFRIRYKDRFAYSIRMDDSLATSPVVKLSLQPVMENYIVHGLDTDRDDNRFDISAVRGGGGRIVVTLRDNGRGMEPQALEALRQRLQRPPQAQEESGSFGLQSILDRLRLVYGSHAAGLDVDSAAGAGTTVTIWFPVGSEERSGGL
ncbi:sensor histidine kinase [Paenibacillus albicereus]|uniref:Sensor histidine kinase n=1 Tax=Paenibacillus albicereus TaxID=2726185 RepID=A0A6H2GT84_9BACL|nr:histidine kinase [Paenibacillus albicereus]QJC50569.1 sensor histidine kinase [Paenibacillus albicereus]